MPILFGEDPPHDHTHPSFPPEFRVRGVFPTAAQHPAFPRPSPCVRCRRRRRAPEGAVRAAAVPGEDGRAVRAVVAATLRLLYCIGRHSCVGAAFVAAEAPDVVLATRPSPPGSRPAVAVAFGVAVVQAATAIAVAVVPRSWPWPWPRS